VSSLHTPKLRIPKAARVIIWSVFLVLVAILVLLALKISALIYSFFADEQKEVSIEQSEDNFEVYHKQIIEYFESTNREYSSTGIEKNTTYSDRIWWTIEYTVGDVEIYLSLENSGEIERYTLRIESNFPKLNDGKTKLPVDMLNDINDIISGHSYSEYDLISLVSSAYEENSHEEDKKMFHYIAYDRNFVGFHENWVSIYSAKRNLDQYEEEFELWGLTKQGSKS